MINQVQHSIISKIRDYISYKNLEAGDKLPSERILSEKFEVSRRNLRDAIAVLEGYELVKSIPQSGTKIAKIGQTALLGVLDYILELEDDTFKSLVETRILLELKTVKLAAERGNKSDIKQIEEKFNLYKNKALAGEDTTQEDILFHLAIAKASGNSTINTLMLQITPKLTSVFEYNRVINKGKEVSRNPTDKSFQEAIQFEIELHATILKAIQDGDSNQAVKCMNYHFEAMLEKID